MNSKFEIVKIAFGNADVKIYTRENGDISPENRSCFIENYIRYYKSVLQHTCINKYGRTFKSCMSHTSLSHFFEHAIIQELVNRENEFSDFKFCGYTKQFRPDRLSFDNEKSGFNINIPNPIYYCITLKYVDDVKALSAIKAAKGKFEEFLNY